MKPLSLAVVGHTNTGKTSLLRTLLRDQQFGEVKNQAATTRHVEEAMIHDGAAPLVKLYDTPGLEDAGGVLDWLEAHTSARLDGIERVQAFLDAAVAKHELSQEAKVLRQLLQSDMALYVVDAREPVLGKYKDELTVLSWCAKPVMPVFNFTATADTEAWRTMLARRGLHVFSLFDTVAFDFQGEIQLWDNLATMLSQREVLDRLMAVRQRHWLQLNGEARREIAHFLLDVAAYRCEIDADEVADPTLMEMRDAVRQAERQLQHHLLQHYLFYQQEISQHDWVLKPFQQDPFDAELWKAYGIRTTSSAAAGALVGLGIDAATLGTSAGLGAAIGGLIGGLLPNVQTLSNKLVGRQTLWIDPATLTLLAARALDLLAVLQARGHAAQSVIDITEKSLPWRVHKLPAVLNKARSQYKWSSLNTHNVEASRAARRDVVQALVNHLP